jgi:hypothetical protein
VSKFIFEEKTFINSIVATLKLRECQRTRLSKEFLIKLNKTITRMALCNIRQKIKRDSYQWYKMMREGQYEYIHEFKERIDEILSLQKKHHEIIEKNEHNPQIEQTSLAH